MDYINDEFIIYSSLVVLAFIFLAITRELYKRICFKVIWSNEVLQIIRNDQQYDIQISKIRRIKLEPGNIGNSRPYRIEYLDEQCDLGFFSIQVSRWNINFEKFLKYVEEHNHFAKIERFTIY